MWSVSHIVGCVVGYAEPHAQQRSGQKQTAVMQACQREIGFSIDGGESSAGEQPHSRYRRIGGGNHFAQRTYPALDLGIVNVSEVYFLTSIQSIGIATDPKAGAGFIGALRQFLDEISVTDS